jgi:arylamine N-acetyltransferase
MALAADVRAAYLARLGLEPEPPSVDALRRLHQRHVERVPYETLWIHGGEPWDTDPAAAATRIAHHGRGGYCYHLNGAFAELLDDLGYAVSRHVGGVHGPDGPDPEELTNHLVLGVADLPTDEAPDGRWYVDVGLGDALHEPVPLAPATHRQGPFALVIADVTPGGVGDWHLSHDPAGSFVGMSWQATPAVAGAFVERHTWLSTSPDSGFVKVATAQRRDATGVDAMRGLVLSRLGDGSVAPTALARRDDWFGALGDLFGLRIDDPDVADRLWSRVRAAHDHWLEAQGDSCP